MTFRLQLYDGSPDVVLDDETAMYDEVKKRWPLFAGYFANSEVPEDHGRHLVTIWETAAPDVFLAAQPVAMITREPDGRFDRRWLGANA